MESKTNLNWTSFKPLFGTWADLIEPFFMQGGLDPIYKQLKKDSARGRKIAPLPEHVFRCFIETPYDDIKAVIVGMSPYHTFRYEKPVADGLLMSCSITGQLQPSLNLFYKAMELELSDGLNLNMIKTPDLSYLAHQGVLLFNIALTVEKDKAGSHISLWDPFVKYLFEQVLDATMAPVILLGKDAAKIRKYIAPFTWIFEVSHPASAAYKHTDWDSEGIFLSVNKVLKDNNNTEINWIKTE